MAAKPYTYYTKKTFEEMDDNAKTLTSIRAGQQAEQLLGMRPDLAKAEYCYLLGKVLQDRAAKLIKDLNKSKEKEQTTINDNKSVWDE